MPVTPSQPGDHLFGRADALDRLIGLLAGGSRDIVLITGEAGIGKSALLAAALDAVELPGPPLVVQAPLRPDRRFGVWSAAGPQLGIELPDADPTVGPTEQVAELTAVLGEALAAGPPAVVAVEDLHRADQWSVEVLAALPAVVRHWVTFVATSRPLVNPDDVRLNVEARAQPVRLGPLGPSAVAAMVRSLTGTEPDDEDLQRLLSTSGGNPLLVRELALDPAGARRSAVVGAVLGSVLERLDDDAREAVEFLALAGPRTPDVVVAAAIGITRDELHDRWRAATVADVLVRRSGRIDFRHDLLAETALARAATAQLRNMHQRLAEAWAVAPRSNDLQRVRHRIAGSPDGDGPTIVQEVRRCAVALVGGQRHADAADLLDEAFATLADDLPAREAALLAADLGDIRMRAGFVDQAVSAYGIATDLAASLDDHHLRARAEVGRLRRRNPFTPDQQGRSVLAALDAALAKSDGDSAVRVAVLGRRAAMAMQPPADNREAMRLAAEGLAMARRLGDPEVVMDALEEWGLAVGEPDEIDMLGEASAELMALALQTGRRDRLLTAYEWRFIDRLRRGDLDGADATVREVEAFAAVSPSPMWGLVALQRRMLVHAYRGQRTTATSLVSKIADLGADVLDHFEVRAIQIGPLASMSMVYGTVDPEIVRLFEYMRRHFDDVPAPFIQIAMAAAEMVLGDDVGGLRRAEPWLRQPQLARNSPNPPITLGLLSLLAQRVGEGPTAASVHRELAPYAGRLACMFDHGIELPVDHHLAGVALVAGAVEQALDHASQATRLAQGMRSPVLEAVCLSRLAEAQLASGAVALGHATRSTAEAVADRVGVELDPPWSGPVPSSAGSLRSAALEGGALRGRPRLVTAGLSRDGKGWHLAVDGGRLPLPDISGMSMLTRLLSTPGVDVSAEELAGRYRLDAAPVEADVGPMLDARAKREYRQRIAVLQEDLHDAETGHDLERASRARLELDALMAELQRAVGIGGRDRLQRSSRERDRVNVTRNLRRAIKAVTAVDATIGGHLRTAIRTGSTCVYAPDPTAAVRVVPSPGR